MSVGAVRVIYVFCFGTLLPWLSLYRFFILMFNLLHFLVQTLEKEFVDRIRILAFIPCSRFFWVLSRLSFEHI